MIIYHYVGFAIKGTEKTVCQDRIYSCSKIIKNGFEECSPNPTGYFFLADGIGGIPGGEIAASYILHSIAKKQLLDHINNHAELEKHLKNINRSLIEYTMNKPEIAGAGTTLVGIMATQESFLLVYAGDSEAWLLRNNDFSRLTFPQNLNPFEDNSPLVSYFGGTSDELDLQIDTSLSLKDGDILLLCSDGLFKVFDEDRIKLILANKQSIYDKGKFIYQKAQEAYRPDDLSCILIEVKKEEEE